MNRLNRENLIRKIKKLPKVPGVYLFKDSRARVLYVGKAKNLRSRVSSYFQESSDLLSSRGPRIADMVTKVLDIDFLECPNEVEALLRESRLIKDIQPPYNERQTDDKTFPYIEITTRDEFPGVYVTRNPDPKSKLFGPFVSPSSLKPAMRELQKIFRFRSCSLNIRNDDGKRRFFRPCLLYAINQCSGPCGGKISREEYQIDIRQLIKFLSGKRSSVIRETNREMERASQELKYERAAKLRDRIKAIDSLSLAGNPGIHLQPEVFFQDPSAGLERLANLMNLDGEPRIIEGIDIANLQGGEACGSLVQFIDGMPFKSGYKRYKIKSAQTNDDYAMIREVVSRRYKHASEGEELLPDLILIDGGPGQLNAAYEAFDFLHFTPPVIVSLAKKEEKIYSRQNDTPVKLPRNDPGLKLLQQIRDEAHRFVQHYHHILRRKKVMGES